MRDARDTRPDVNAEPSLVAFLIAVSVGLASVAGAFAASLIVRATRDDLDPDRP